MRQSVAQSIVDMDMPDSGMPKRHTEAQPDTPKAHWERFREATQKAFATPKSELAAELVEEKAKGTTSKK